MIGKVIRIPFRTIGLPLLAWLVFFASLFIHWGPFLIVMTLALAGSVLSAVYHAEVIAHRIGEPFGSLVLALAVTIIEVSLIIAIMASGGEKATVLARDTVFAAVMIILNGMIGLSILAGSLRFKVQIYRLQGINSALTILVAISVLTLILPNFTASVPGPFYSRDQLIFVSLVTLVLYGTFLLVQNIRHREYFVAEASEDHPVDPPDKKTAWISTFMLLVCLGSVVMLAEHLAPDLEKWVLSVGAPVSLVGVIIACLILMPEGLSAVKSARRNHLQKSLNLSLGSALASIGLTIPAVALISVFTGMPLTLGIDAKSMVLFLLSLFVIVLSLSTGKSTILQGVVLLVIFSVYLFITIIP
ncbi:MAG: hypothetical protein LWW85_04775 [Marinilabiliales bacterium]|nr:hypothetical protein [Marinilabiliales bacterium]